MRSIAWNIGGPGFIDVAEIHRTNLLISGKKKRLGF